MSIATELNNLINNVDAGYTALGFKGATIPDNKNTENLATTVASIPSPVYATVVWHDEDNDEDVTLTITKEEDFATLGSPTAVSTSGSIAPASTWSFTVDNVTYDAANLKSVVLGNSAVILPNYFLAKCGNSLTSVTLNNNITALPAYALSNNPYLSTVTLGNNIVEMNNYCLYNDTRLVSLSALPSTLKIIGQNFLAGCGAFNSDITLPSGLTYIGYGFLYNASSMTSTVNVGALDASIAATTSNQTFSSNSASASSVTTGITIKGSNTAAWLTRFPNRTSNPYRNLINGETA